MFQGLGSDLRYVVRGLRRSPGFVMVAVFSLALGIGANTAMFGVIRTLLLTPLPVDRPEQLTLLTWRREGDFDINQNGSSDYEDPAGGARLGSNFSYPLYRALQEATPTDVDLFAFAFVRGMSVAVGDQPAMLAGGALADGRYFSALRVPMALGRPLTEADDTPGVPLVAVLSHAFWMRAFGGDPAILGRTVRVNGVPAEVVGVTAAGFRGLSMGGFFPQTEITLPLASQPVVYTQLASGADVFASEMNFWLRLMARVPDGQSVGAVEAALASAFRAAPSPLSGGDGYLPELRLIPGSQGAQPVRRATARLLYLLLGVVGLVLLIACVNLAGLMLGRGIGRQREMAVRRALGGGRGRLVRQFLLESLVLAGLGTALGLVFAVSSRRIIGDLLTGSLGSGAFGNLDMQVGLDPVVLGVSVGTGVAATLLFGLLPAARLTAADPMAWLKQRASGAGAPRLTLGRVLIAGQIAVSVPLVVGAALFLRTVMNIGAVELGFDPRGLVMFKVDPGYTRRPPDQYARLYQEVMASVQTVPGVRQVTLIENIPMSGIVSNSSMEVDGKRVSVYRNAVGPSFLDTFGMRLLAGRTPGVQDDADAPPVAAVNETAARVLFGGASPVGRLFHIGGRDVHIVGVVNDMPYRNQRDEVPPTLYESALQREGYGGHHVAVRTDVPPAQLEPLIRAAVTRVDPDLPVPELRAQTAVMAQTNSKERVFSQLLVVFGGFALLLASIGLHGVTSYAVTRRTSEIGVRVAVGARPGQVLWLILRQVLGLAVIGLVVGVPASVLAAPLVGSLLYGVAPTDPSTIAGAALVLVVVAVAAGLIPALRAARMDALSALRVE